MMFTIGDLRKALRGVPDEALLEIDVVLQETDAAVGRPSINAVDLFKLTCRVLGYAG